MRFLLRKTSTLIPLRNISGKELHWVAQTDAKAIICRLLLCHLWSFSCESTTEDHWNNIRKINCDLRELSECNLIHPNNICSVVVTLRSSCIARRLVSGVSCFSFFRVRSSPFRMDIPHHLLASPSFFNHFGSKPGWVRFRVLSAIRPICDPAFPSQGHF